MVVRRRAGQEGPRSKLPTAASFAYRVGFSLSPAISEVSSAFYLRERYHHHYHHLFFSGRDNKSMYMNNPGTLVKMQAGVRGDV